MKSARVRLSVAFTREKLDGYIHYMAEQISRKLIESVMTKLTERIEEEIDSYRRKHPECYNIDVVASIPEKLDEIISFSSLVYTRSSDGF